MTDSLLEENRSLRKRVNSHADQVRQNDRKILNLQSFELQLIGVESLPELIQMLLYPALSKFNWDVISLLLLDPEYEVRRVLDEQGVDEQQHPNLIFVADHSKLDILYPQSLFPMPSDYIARRHHLLFPKKRKAPASIMLLPLVRHGKLIGSLNLGSLAKDRFVKGNHVNLYEHLAAVVAICLENAMNMDRLKKQGLTDTLTAVNNRRFYDQRLLEEIEAAKRNKLSLSCLLLDIDHFKNINDGYGHLIGDVVLKDIAAIIRAQLRGSDVLARYGGEEFSALLPVTDEDAAMEVAERVRSAVENKVFCFDDGDKFSVTVSIGVATYDPLSDENSFQMRGDFLVNKADECLYQCKEAGRNRVASAGKISAGKVSVPVIYDVADGG